MLVMFEKYDTIEVANECGNVQSDVGSERIECCGCLSSCYNTEAHNEEVGNFPFLPQQRKFTICGVSFTVLIGWFKPLWYAYYNECSRVQE